MSKMKRMYYTIYLSFSNHYHSIKWKVAGCIPKRKLPLKKKRTDNFRLDYPSLYKMQVSSVGKDLINPFEEKKKERELDQYYICRQEMLHVTRSQLTNFSIKNIPVCQYPEKGIRGKQRKREQYFIRNGLMAQSMEWSYLLREDGEDLLCLQKYFKEWIKRNRAVTSLENGMNGYTLIFMDQIFSDGRHSPYREAVEKIKEFIFSSPKDKYGSILLQREDYYDIYADSIGMICPFLSRYGAVYHNQEAVDLAVMQILNFNRNAFDAKTCLPYHGYHVGRDTKYGIIGWGRAVGWLLLGMADCIAHLSCKNANYKQLKNQFCTIVKSVVRYQMGNGYYKWQLTAYEGPVDTSATAMICYAIKRGVMTGILGKSYLCYSDLGLQALLNSLKEGKLEDSSAESLGFGLYPQTYGFYPWAQGMATSLILLNGKDEVK